MDDRDETGASQAYQYTLLSDPTSQIRLLEVVCGPTEANGRIRCKLTNWDMETAPSYHAISYTWGPEEPTETILLDHGLASVRKNCADVLRRLVHFKGSRYYWLDALALIKIILARRVRKCR
jgi:hypothetical protein